MLLPMSTGTPILGPELCSSPHSGHGRREIVADSTTTISRRQGKTATKPVDVRQAWRHHVRVAPESALSTGVAGIWAIQDRANQVPYHGPCQEPVK